MNDSVGSNCESCSQKCEFQVLEKIHLLYIILFIAVNPVRVEPRGPTRLKSCTLDSEIN